MYYVIHCGGMPFSGGTLETRSLGGSESAAYYLARELAKSGHQVTVFTGEPHPGIFDGVKYEYAGETSGEFPLGRNFHFYAQHTPHDVCIIQRHPHAFRSTWASKVNLLWLHDLALKRSKNEFLRQMWNVDGVLVVSEFHKAQVVEVYDLDPDFVHVVNNGVDLELYDDCLVEWVKPAFLINGKKALVYTSRPERGLENLVGPDGIMERIAEECPDYHLYVASYDNVAPQMRDYYAFLDTCCERLPNVTRVGALTKTELANLQQHAYLAVYPTIFEEVSCITAMECMAAGLPLVTSKVAALPETCAENVTSGTTLVPLLESGQPNLNTFVAELSALYADKDAHRARAAAQWDAAPFYSWAKVAERVTNVVATTFEAAVRRSATLVRHLMTHSDIMALQKYIDGREALAQEGDAIAQGTVDELSQLYGFTDDIAEHYQGAGEYVLEYIERSTRKDWIDAELKALAAPELDCADGLASAAPEGDVLTLGGRLLVIDYGCREGRHTMTFARDNPEIEFIGCDVDAAAIGKAREWAALADHGNVAFCLVEELDEFLPHHPDVILCSEVLEHQPNLAEFISGVHGHARKGTTVMWSTPYGPWESLQYREWYPRREHLHHLERADLADLFGEFPHFGVTNAPSPGSLDLPAIGSYISRYEYDPEAKVGEVDYCRKTHQVAPQQTLSLCILAHDSEADILKALKSVVPHVDEVVVQIDETARDRTEFLVREYMQESWPLVPLQVYTWKSPLEIGFDTARNESISRASGDWILWLDADEEVVVKPGFKAMLRNNQFNGYAIPQHHFTMEPPGVLKTDYPCRIFRNGKGIQFYGVVHEHPERALNKGVGKVLAFSQMEIRHNGYVTEAVRRKRFERNYELLVRDREKYPTRKLGHMLWLRDLMQLSKYEAERNGGKVTKEMVARAVEGAALWRTLVDLGEARLATESLPFYSGLCSVLGPGVEAAVSVAATETPGGLGSAPQPDVSVFASVDDLRAFANMLINDRTKDFGGKY